MIRADAGTCVNGQGVTGYGLRREFKSMRDEVGIVDQTVANQSTHEPPGMDLAYRPVSVLA